MNVAYYEVLISTVKMTEPLLSIIGHSSVNIGQGHKTPSDIIRVCQDELVVKVGEYSTSN